MRSDGPPIMPGRKRPQQKLYYKHQLELVKSPNHKRRSII